MKGGLALTITMIVFFVVCSAYLQLFHHLAGIYDGGGGLVFRSCTHTVRSPQPGNVGRHLKIPINICNLFVFLSNIVD